MMALGDVSITAQSLAAGASLQIQVATRCMIRAGMNGGEADGRIAISSDNSTYYTIGAFGWLSLSQSGATSQSNKDLPLPAGYYIQATNIDTSAHDVAIFAIEY